MFHNLTADYRPLGEPDANPVFPLHPSRVRNLIYGFALAARDEAVEFASAGMAG